MEEVPRRTSLVPLAFPCFVLRLIGLETKNVLDYQGRAGDHFHCTVEPSPGHIRCANWAKTGPFGAISALPPYPEGPARHLDASRQKLTPHCLAAIFDSQLPSPKLSPKMPPKLPLPHTRGHFFLFQKCPRGEGNCAAIEQQKLSRGNFCLAASRCLSRPSGYLWGAEDLVPIRPEKALMIKHPFVSPP